MSKEDGYRPEASQTFYHVIVTLRVHHKSQQIDTRYKILQKDFTMYLL